MHGLFQIGVCHQIHNGHGRNQELEKAKNWSKSANILYIVIYKHILILSGNFWYFYHRKDYSFFRLCKMMWRLNFLVLIVMAITNHEFVRYYVCAMHTYWFLTVYAMLAVFARYNHVSQKP